MSGRRSGGAASDDPFPDPNTADENGIVCVGAEPDPALLRVAYPKGIFPWPHDGMPLLWFSPDPRFVLEPSKAHVHRSLKKALRKTSLVVRADTAFNDVMRACSSKKRRGQRGTWITPAMVAGYTALHAEGIAHSIEAWRGDVLVGGLYGLSFGRVFFGESMFQTEEDASKIAFSVLLAQLRAWRFSLVDCQSHTEHLARFGAVHWPRRAFLAHLSRAVKEPGRPGHWALDQTPATAAALAWGVLPAAEDEDGD